MSEEKTQSGAELSEEKTASATIDAKTRRDMNEKVEQDHKAALKNKRRRRHYRA